MGDQVGVVTAWRYPAAVRPMVTVEDVVAVQRMIDEGGRYRHDIRSRTEPWVGIAVAQVLGLDLERVPDRKEVTRLIGEWLTKGWLATEQLPGSDSHPHAYVVVGTVRPGGPAVADGDEVPF